MSRSPDDDEAADYSAFAKFRCRPDILAFSLSSPAQLSYRPSFDASSARRHYDRPPPAAAHAARRRHAIFMAPGFSPPLILLLMMPSAITAARACRSAAEFAAGARREHFSDSYAYFRCAGRRRDGGRASCRRCLRHIIIARGCVAKSKPPE